VKVFFKTYLALSAKGFARCYNISIRLS